MFAFPNTRSHFQYLTVRFIEREFGIEYTSYERKRINEIYSAIRKRSKEISGYVLWVNRYKTFLIVPTLSSPYPYVFCQIPEWMEIDLPANNSYVIARGVWNYRPRVIDRDNLTASLVFGVEQYKKIKPDIDSFKPDISFKDFREILFESLQNVDYYQQDLIAHSLVSSPRTFNRAGGLTLSFYNESKGTSRLMLRHLRRYLPKEFSHQRGYALSVKEVGHSIIVDPFHWLYKQYNADMDFPIPTMNLLKRSSDITSDEITISLRSERANPKTLKDPPVSMSDVPIVAGKDIERRRAFFDPSPEVFKFMIATHMVPVTLSSEVYDSTLDYIQERLSLITNNETFLNERGKGSILDMNVHGKPLSLLHIALSDGRSNVQQEINDAIIKKAVKLFEMNIIDTLDKWELAFQEKGTQDLSQFSTEQRMIIGYTRKNGPSSPEQVFAALKNEMSHDLFMKMWKDLHERGGIYEKRPNVFYVAQFNRE